MKRVLFYLYVAAFLLLPGCGIIEQQFTDIGGWDLSACVEDSGGRSTCLELFWDNLDKFSNTAGEIEETLNE